MEEHIPKLPKAPLQEVIFQLFWQLDVDEEGNPIDPKFDAASARFAQALEREFPERREMNVTLKGPDAPQVQAFRVVNIPSLQFWSPGKKHPVIQIGQGILTVNQVEAGYEWTSYRALIHSVVTTLQESYDGFLSITGVGLEYVDVARTEDYPPKSGPREFINDYFKFQLTGGPSLLGEPNNLALSHGYVLPDKTELNLRITSGRNKESAPVIIWRTAQNRRIAMSSLKELNDWLDKAHSLARDLFKHHLVKQDFYESFTK